MPTPRDPSDPATQAPPRPVAKPTPNPAASGDLGGLITQGQATATPPKKAPAKAPPKKAPAKPAAASQGVTMSQFAADVLKGLGIPATAENIKAFQAWAQAEGGHAAFNPLNTTQDASGASNYNSVGVKNYTSYEQGVAATVKTLQNGQYEPIMNALRSGSSAMSVAQAVAQTPWGTGGGVVRVLGGTVKDSTVSGTTTGVTAGNTLNTANPSNDTIISQVEGTYGYPASYLKNPEIGPILLEAAKAGWDANRLFGALSKTNWWKQHSAATRTFDAQTQLDPATQQQKIMAQADDILAQAKRAGLELDQTAVAKMAWTSLRYGWSSQQLANAIVAQGKMDLSGNTPNAALKTVADLKQQAAQYMVPVSDQQLATWAKQIAGGQFTEQEFDGYLKEQAKSLFPGLASAIDRGVTVEQYADPYRQQAAQILEVDPQSVDFMNDPKFKPALFQIDPKTKERTAMSLGDWDTYLRKLPDYAQTHQANQQAAQFGNSLLQQFGAIA